MHTYCGYAITQTPIISHPVPPFPYSQALLPDTNIRDVIVNSWRPEQPDPVPQGWTINWVSPWEDQERDYPWARFVATTDSIALHMEHVRSFFLYHRQHRKEPDRLNCSVLLRCGSGSGGIITATGGRN